jgi:hypothetical protein
VDDWQAVFFPDRHDGHRVREAKALCGGCGVRDECLADVLRVPGTYDRHGVRAGMTPKERATIRRERGEEPHQSRDLDLMMLWTATTGHRRRAS